MTGVEVDFVVSDCLAALALYESIFDTTRIEATAYPKGLNEAIFSLYGTRFHLLDENPEYQLNAPKPGDPPGSLWLNIVAPDIKAVFDKAIQAGCVQIQPVTEMADFGVANAIFRDPYGYVWMLHQINREVSFEERCRIMEEKMGIEGKL